MNWHIVSVYNGSNILISSNKGISLIDNYLNPELYFIYNFKSCYICSEVAKEGVDIKISSSRDYFEVLGLLASLIISVAGLPLPIILL